MAAGEPFPVTWNEAGERAGGRGCPEPVFRAPASDVFGKVAGDERVAGTDRVHSLNTDCFLAEHLTVDQGEGAVRAELDDSLAWTQVSYPSGKVLGFAGPDGDGGFVVAREHNVRERDDVPVDACRRLPATRDWPGN